MGKYDDMKIIALKHTSIETAKPEVKKILENDSLEVPRLTVEIINNRWRALSLHGTMMKLDPEVEKIVRAALEAIARTTIIMDQRDIYYSIRMGHPNWKLAGHDMKTEEAYNTFVGQIMEKLQLSTGFTMQSLGVRAGPRGYITGDNYSYFTLNDGRKIPINASPVIQFNLVDFGTEFKTQARKLIHYEKAAGMNSLLINDIPLMIEAVFMTSQGYNVEAATKMHSDMEKRGLGLYVLGDADPHGMSIQLMYGRASKSNAYMPESFYPKKATLLGLFPRIALELDLPPEHITDIHMRVVPNLKKLMEETNPDMLPDAEVIETQRKQWEWQSLNGLDPTAPALYMIEALYAKNDEIKFVPNPETVKEVIKTTITNDVEEFVNKTIEDYAQDWLIDNLKERLVTQLKTDLEGDIAQFKQDAEQELEKLEQISPEDLREAIKLKLVNNPKQYWTNAARKLIDDMCEKQFKINANIVGSVDTQKSATAEVEVTILDPETPEKPLEKHDIVEAIEKRITKNYSLVDKLRQAIQNIMGRPNEEW